MSESHRSSDQKLYAARDISAQGEHYTRHMQALTAECLLRKSDVAAELAHRDIEIERLRKDAARYRYLRDRAPMDKITVETFGRPDGVMHLAGDELDEAIDEEMSK